MVARDIETSLADPDDLSLEDSVVVVRRLDLLLEPIPGTEQWIDLAVGIDTCGWVSGSLVVALHSKSDWGDQELQISVTAEAVELDPVDPSEIFAGSLLAAVSIDDNWKPGQMGLVELARPVGSKARVRLSTSKAALEAAQPHALAITVWLHGQLHRAPDFILE